MSFPSGLACCRLQSDAKRQFPTSGWRRALSCLTIFGLTISGLPGQRKSRGREGKDHDGTSIKGFSDYPGAFSVSAGADSDGCKR